MGLGQLVHLPMYDVFHLVACRVIIMLQQFITLTLYNEQAITEPVENATKLLGLLSMANEQSGAVELSEFYNDAVNNEDFNVKEDFRRWKNVSMV